jgi:4-amino-4-deoxy-L-arabinose transferase-like glycosyltransferase
MKPRRRDIIIAVLIFAVALAVRIISAQHVFAGDFSFPQGDDDDYYNIAMSVLRHGFFGIDGVPTAYRMPFYPLFVAFWHMLFGPQPYAILPVMLIVGSLIAVGTYVLGLRLAGRPAAITAGLLIAFDDQIAVYSTLYMTDVLFTLLVLASMLSLSRLRATGRWAWAATAGLLFGCAAVTRANFLPFIVPIACWLLWYGRANLRVALGWVLLVGGLAAALWVPWVVRNYLTFGVLIPFTTQSGGAYYGLYHDLYGIGQADKPYGSWQVRDPHPPETPGKVWDEVALDKWQRDQARLWMATHPGKAAKIALLQIYFFWQPEGRPLFDWGPFVLVGLPALVVFTLRRRDPDLLLWLGLALTMSVLAVVSVGVARYHMPLRPILAVTFVMAVMAMIKALSPVLTQLRQIRAPVVAKGK